MSKHVQELELMNNKTEKQFYAEIKDWPRPQYPFPDLVNPDIDKLAAEADEWIDHDCLFESKEAREAHKRHRFTDLVSRAYPSLTSKEQHPVARFTVFFSIIDDYLDHSTHTEMNKVKERVAALLTGEDDKEPEPGFDRQVYMIRQDALTCKMPPHLYEQFTDYILKLMTSYGDEKCYVAANRPPPFPVFQVIRHHHSGGLPYAKYLCMQKNYRSLPDAVLRHPIILRMHDLCGSLIGYHNDFISLPKELSRKGDVVNLIITIQSEFGLSLKDAYLKALEIHNNDLADFIVLQNNLPDFGEWQRTAQAYVVDLGIMVQGVYSWHIKNSGRYVPGAFVHLGNDAI